MLLSSVLRPFLALGFGALALLAPSASAAQSGCAPDWLPTFGGKPGVAGEVTALATHDDGQGEALYVGGAFAEAGGSPANNVARWDG